MVYVVFDSSITLITWYLIHAGGAKPLRALCFTSGDPAPPYDCSGKKSLTYIASLHSPSIQAFPMIALLSTIPGPFKSAKKYVIRQFLAATSIPSLGEWAS